MILINTMEPWCAIPVHIPISSLNGPTGGEGERGEREVFVFLTSKLFPKVVSYFQLAYGAVALQRFYFFKVCMRCNW